MSLRTRIERLELAVKTQNGDYEINEKRMRKIIGEWMDNDPEAIPLFEGFERYCMTKGYPFKDDERRKFIKADPVAMEMDRKWQESYLIYAERHYGGELKQ